MLYCYEPLVPPSCVDLLRPKFDKILKDFSLHISMDNVTNTPLWLHPIPIDHDLNRFEFTIPKDASKHVSYLLAD